MEKHWYRSSHDSLAILLLPFSWIFRSLVALRRWLYRVGIKKTYRFSAPVIIVGNITVGGTGKTPFVIWLADFLRTHGYRPGIVSRGVGGRQQRVPRQVKKNSDPKIVGDEALLLSKRTECPVIIGIDRVAAVKTLLAQTDCNVVISDDGLQHYRLARDIEILLKDPTRGFGNGSFLPAGPLRESKARLKEVDFVSSIELQGETLVLVSDHEKKLPLHHFRNKKIHAVAAIGNPKRFFNLLRDAGLDIIEHVFPDHYLYEAEDFEFSDNLPIVMTEKDAVKCKAFANTHFWYLPVNMKADPQLGEELLRKLSYSRG